MSLRRVLTIFSLALPVFAQYAGPAILSRGEAPTALVLPQITFRPYVTITGVYDTGLAGVLLANPQGDLADTKGYGIEVSGGIGGAHSWKTTRIGLDYSGSIRHYNRSTYYDNGDQSLMLSLSHRFTRHTTLSLRESAGLYSRSFGLPGMTSTMPFDPTTSYIPNTDFFDNRTIYVVSQADLTMQKSSRLSFNMGGDYFLTRRRSTALYGVTGNSARGDMQYRWSRHTTIGLNYTFSRFHFTRIFSSTDLHSISATYAVRLTERLEFASYGGAMRVESKFVQSVPVDPIIAALFGIVSTTEVRHGIIWIPNVNARLSLAFKNGVAYVGGGHTATPGNGLFLTSYMTTASGGYNYTGIRRWALGVQSDYSRGSSVANVNGVYSNVSGGFSAARHIARSMHLVASFTARQYNSPDFSKYNRLIYSARVGLAFAPGEIPLRAW